MLLTTPLFYLTRVSFGKTDRRFSDTQSVVRDPRNRGSCLWLRQSHQQSPPHPALTRGPAPPRVAVNLRLHRQDPLSWAVTFYRVRADDVTGNGHGIHVGTSQGGPDGRHAGPCPSDRGGGDEWAGRLSSADGT